MAFLWHKNEKSLLQIIFFTENKTKTKIKLHQLN